MKTIKIAFFSCVFFLVACEKNDEMPSEPGQDPTISINEFFPMNIGNYWVYEFVSKDPNGDLSLIHI